MIVRNEAAILERCLASVLPAVDCFEVCDTGSEDGTPELVRDFFARHGVPGTVHAIPFVDFGRTRNEALARARASAATFDYLLLADADMELVVENPGFRDRLAAPAYLVRQRNGLDYYNVRLLRRDAPARYVGATHEYLEVEGERPRLEGIHFLDHASGSNRPLKTVRDVALLRRELEEDPGNARAMFYLAQTYRDAGMFAEAAEWYERRLAAGGWDEERWFARWMLATCRAALGDEGGFVKGCLEAYAERPWRAEPLHALAGHYRTTGRHEACMLLCEAGERIPYPAGDTLFVSREVYRTGFFEEASISGFYCRDPERRQRGREACQAIAVDRQAPAPTRNGARANLAYYAPAAAEMFPGFAARSLASSPWGELAATNPSVARHGDITAAIVRCVNYTVADGVYTIRDAGGRIRTRNLFVTLDGDFTAGSGVELADRTAVAPLPGGPVAGFEDCRLFFWNGRWWASCTVRDRNPDWRCQIALIAWEPDGAVTQLRLLGEVEPGRHEKNWMPLVRDGELFFVYSTDPTRILHVDAGGRLTEHATGAPGLALDHLRGGTQAVAVADGWLCLTHEACFGGGPRTYLHRFVQLDGELRVRATTDPFHLVRRGIEFAAGLVYDAPRARFVASFGVADAEAMLGFFPEDAVRAALRPA